MQIKNGTTVKCTDDENADQITKNVLYIVEEVTYRGHIVKLAGVNGRYAATRFAAVTWFVSNPPELLHASS